ncbi:hypothetical protein GS910_22885 [Paraburkholderia sp. RL16-012-BIC-B]|nr:hypothetical protein [Paraburkholderia madseniana]
MSASVDPAQALLEIVHALSKRFPDPSAAVTNTLLSNGVLSVQISRVVAKATMNILDERCVLNLAFAPNVLDQPRCSSPTPTSVRSGTVTSIASKPSRSGRLRSGSSTGSRSLRPIASSDTSNAISVRTRSTAAS